ncbi:hypothetical protein PHYBLDRAFT_143320 [Phycomyces blakesleeanus NRRL 1555(-)]|uniref:Uncharacterized protein n=1 Tax=Phycomyces blakesleeanus (strain ATCC 8743b / DSM 1359 / FGSC 10004 / NBRC 33097 / NRRL 1555) TaxID=763407 RepID=A0A163AWX3_PHYB8|nr:hypothetical protein PHYBLDRAFT_143320 [Phycomyces blakesleeanus NRRL 1555(-)]OAD76341.1 hypothetical protein PHYBLDRAFT_143320 [Phycomyces blakesleeanus NRRL 1555(-)]|eukprot:XP_018294381.1 hypothetical protein PHYBLDRAFT_143320 [Phycomyces blakesleeanus NRRL 1555(-)]
MTMGLAGEGDEWFVSFVYFSRQIGERFVDMCRFGNSLKINGIKSCFSRHATVYKELDDLVLEIFNAEGLGSVRVEMMKELLTVISFETLSAGSNFTEERVMVLHFTHNESLFVFLFCDVCEICFHLLPSGAVKAEVPPGYYVFGWPIIYPA